VEKVFCTPLEAYSTEEIPTPMKAKGDDNLKREIEKYKRLIHDAPDPNCGRVYEIKEAIRQGKYLTKEAIQQTAERIAARFLGRE